jgi:hypothetical protein
MVPAGERKQAMKFITLILFLVATSVFARTDFVVAQDFDGIVEVHEILGDSRVELKIRANTGKNIGIYMDDGNKLKIDGELEMQTGEDIIFSDARSSSVGTSAKPALKIFTDDLDISGVPLLTGTVHAGALVTTTAAITADIMFVGLNATSGADTVLTLPDAATNKGRMVFVNVYDAVDTAHNIVVKSAGVKIGISATPAGASGVDAATGVTSAVDGKCSMWISDGTNWNLAMDNAGDWVTE